MAIRKINGISILDLVAFNGTSIGSISKINGAELNLWGLNWNDISGTGEQIDSNTETASEQGGTLYIDFTGVDWGTNQSGQAAIYINGSFTTLYDFGSETSSETISLNDTIYFKIVPNEDTVTGTIVVRDTNSSGYKVDEMDVNVSPP